MTGIRFISLIPLALLVVACASSPERRFTTPTSNHGAVVYETGATPVSASAPGARVDATALIARSSAHQKVGNPYSVAGRTYYPVREDSYDRVGIGSWYGPNFHGRATANGEVFDQNLMTAAHTTLPIPSIAEVTNLENGRSVIVRINDRGPFVDDRIIDLSRAAATELDYIGRGLARVRVRYLGPALPGDAPPPRTWYPASDAETPPAAPEPVTEMAARTAEPAPQSAAWIPTATERFTLQIGAFSDADNAQRFASRVEEAGQVWIEPGQAAGNTVYRVYFGRWPDEGAAHAARASLADWGVYDARVIDLH